MRLLRVVDPAPLGRPVDVSWRHFRLCNEGDAAIAKIVLGGSTVPKDLNDLSTLLGDRDETTDTVSIGDHGTRSVQRSVRRVPVMPPETIRTLPFGNALVLLRSAPPLSGDVAPSLRQPAGLTPAMSIVPSIDAVGAPRLVS